MGCFAECGWVSRNGELDWSAGSTDACVAAVVPVLHDSIYPVFGQTSNLVLAQTPPAGPWSCRT